MSAADLLIWGVVLHLVIDWLGQNEWIAVNKAKRRKPFGWTWRGVTHKRSRWWDRHPAAWVHAGMHGAVQLMIFPWWAAAIICITHLLIDTRTPVQWWSEFIRQTQPEPQHGAVVKLTDELLHGSKEITMKADAFDIGTEVRIWADQVWHIGVIALTALVVTL